MPVRKAKTIDFHELESVTPLQRLRWEMHRKRSMDIADISKEHGVSEAVVRQSIARVDSLLGSYTLEEAARLQVEKIRSLHRAETKMLHEALRAENDVVVDGEVIASGAPDWDTRLRAFEALTGRLEAVQPKGKGIEIDLSRKDNHLHVQPGGDGHKSPGRGFEDILRRIESSQRQLPEASGVVLEVPMMTEADEQAAAEAEKVAEEESGE